MAFVAYTSSLDERLFRLVSKSKILCAKRSSRAIVKRVTRESFASLIVFAYVSRPEASHPLLSVSCQISLSHSLSLSLSLVFIIFLTVWIRVFRFLRNFDFLLWALEILDSLIFINFLFPFSYYKAHTISAFLYLFFSENSLLFLFSLSFPLQLFFALSLSIHLSFSLPFRELPVPVPSFTQASHERPFECQIAKHVLLISLPLSFSPLCSKLEKHIESWKWDAIFAFFEIFFHKISCNLPFFYFSGKIFSKKNSLYY